MLFSIQKTVENTFLQKKVSISLHIEGETVNSIIKTNTWQLQFVGSKPLITGHRLIFRITLQFSLSVSVSNPLIGVFQLKFSVCHYVGDNIIISLYMQVAVSQ